MTLKCRFFEKYEFLKGKTFTARCTVKAATYVECQVLNKTDFIKLMLTYPDIVASIRNEIQERILRALKRKQKQDRNAPLSLNIYASIHRKKSSIKCLKNRLRYLQGTQRDKFMTLV